MSPACLAIVEEGDSTKTRVKDDIEISKTRSARDFLDSLRSIAGLRHLFLPLSLSLSHILVQDYLGKQRTGQWSPAFWMDLMYRGGTRVGWVWLRYPNEKIVIRRICRSSLSYRGYRILYILSRGSHWWAETGSDSGLGIAVCPTCR